MPVPSSALSADPYVLVVALFVAAGWGLAGLPDPATNAGKLLPGVVVALTIAATAVQWLTHQRAFGANPPLLGPVSAILATALLAPFHGQVAVLVSGAAGLMLAYTERIVVASSDRFGDAATGATAVILFGVIPAEALLLRGLPSGGSAWALYLFGVLLFSVGFAIAGGGAGEARVNRPGGASRIRQGFLPAVTGGVLLLAGVTLAAVVAGDPFGLWLGLVLGAGMALACVLGSFLPGVLAPAPPDRADGTRRRRRPMLVDVLVPVFLAAPVAYGILLVGLD